MDFHINTPTAVRKFSSGIYETDKSGIRETWHDVSLVCAKGNLVEGGSYTVTYSQRQVRRRITDI